MTQPLPRSLRERIGHSLAFEGIAVLICAPAMAWFMGKPLLQLGALTLMFSTVAMLWNMLFNYLFDRAQSRLGFERGLWARVCHALLFEGGLVVMLVPLAAWWLSIGLLEALLLDIVLILFFLPYTMAFNWIYDVLRARLLARREAQANAAICRGA
ncbi:multidrug/biocide efflux PACE transporter [Pseudomonas berkeleyensis]|uniref:Multidrug/biocide efflux PACE transporter n=1 Tax=Pseudomonas berkeleyensis TaxID=2726956 RepID=A0A7G5DKL6_9PSED|nr:multidrug/biocide efflux PACE transporter [Pseudomonas berkeleyensis]QMV62291.1 multidrug/biocide efflux PACE transporter [Pseudomonas berkeleyensis]WSO37734.1 multidrug/biocide efflux PACE transporter [Pseudomonas berkeleyensis]